MVPILIRYCRERNIKWHHSLNAGVPDGDTCDTAGRTKVDPCQALAGVLKVTVMLYREAMTAVGVSSDRQLIGDQLKVLKLT